MRIIAGSRRGRTIAAPKGMDTRPTLDRVKESLFGIIQFDIAGKRVLDLFAGSGNLGLEALSRGAEYAVFNDHGRQAAAVIRQNVDKLGFSDNAYVLCMDYAQAIKAAMERGGGFDIVFLDPPYKAGLAAGAMTALIKLSALNEGAMVIVEHGASMPSGHVDGYELYDVRTYRDAALSFYRQGVSHEEGDISGQL